MGNSQLDKLEKETDELEAAIFNTTGRPTIEEKSDEEEGKEVGDNEEEDNGPSAEAELSQESTDSKEKRKYTDWKTRYVSLRSHHDALAFDLRKEISELKTSLVSASKRISELQDSAHSNAKDVDIYSQEERDILGDEAIAAMKKATNHAIAPLQEELRKEKELRMKQLEREADNDRLTSQRNFLSRLGRLVPDFATIDTNPKFIEWMQGIEDYSGAARKDLFKRAEANGDVARVAEFFVTFKNMTKGNSLESKITPTGTNTGTQSVKQGDDFVVDMRFIDKFYDDVTHGKYKGRAALAKEIEFKIDQAILQGRVRK